MIWQLVKRDRQGLGAALLWAVLFGAGAAVSDLLPLPARQPSRDAFRLAFATALAMAPSLLVVIVLMVQSQRAAYEAALPIGRRDLWTSRVLALLGLVWLPLLAAVAGGLPALRLLAAGSVYTVVILAVKSVELRGLDPARRMGSAAIRILALALLAVSVLGRRVNWTSWLVVPSAGNVLAICGVASVALFWWSWRHMPGLTETAPRESAAARKDEAGDGPVWTWMPVFRSMYALPMLLLVAFLVANILSGSPWVASLVIGAVQVQIRGRCRWLLALPVSPRKLFGWMALPPAAAIVAACLVSIFTGAGLGLSGRGRLVEVAAELAVLYALMFLSELPAWRRLRRLTAARFGAAILWTPFVVAAFAPLLVLPDGDSIQRLAEALPGAGWQLAGVLMLPVVVAYWLAEKAFREQEYRAALIDAASYPAGLQ